ncbi:formin-like protein 14 [Panicum virgatum]|uniref:formin-like protein 14 n=1 Tax=Panicum virgatum TaxID=38727 RepID=UPI0019D4F5C8|nr:formin-like protein 14 [Panicum virgatum]
MVMLPRSSSSGMQSIRRELQRRRPRPLAPKRSAASKPSPPPPLEVSRYTGREPRPRAPRQEDPSSTASKPPPGSSAGTHAPRPPRPRPPHPSPRPTVISPSTPPPPPPRSTPSSIQSASPSTLGTDEHMRPVHGGYEVIYDGNWPPGDPYGTVHVPRQHVRMIKPSPSPTTPPPSLPPYSAPSSSATAAAARMKEMRPAPRPTTGGKSLRLIRSLLPEMENQTSQLFGSCREKELVTAWTPRAASTPAAQTAASLNTPPGTNAVTATASHAIERRQRQRRGARRGVPGQRVQESGVVLRGRRGEGVGANPRAGELATGGGERFRLHDGVAWTRTRELAETGWLLRAEETATSVELIETNAGVYRRCLRLLLREVTTEASGGRDGVEDGNASD